MSMRMRRKRNFDERMAACGDLLLAKRHGGNTEYERSGGKIIGL